MCSAGIESPATRWLAENGPKELELLFRAIVFHPSAPILIADDDRNYRDASVGAGKLLGLPREKIIGRRVDDFARARLQAADFGALAGLSRSRASRRARSGWWVRMEACGKSSTSAKGNVLPVRHLLVLRDKTKHSRDRGSEASTDHSVLGAGLCAVPVGCGRTDCRLVCGSGAHLRLQER